MASDLLGPEDALPEPPAAGPGLFGDPPEETPRAPPLEARADTAPTAAGAAPYRVLARKYRPQDFADLIGQDALVRTLRNAFAQGRVAHGFMLTGVRGVGKTTTARIIARALNCVGPDGNGGPTADPCGVCPECTAILADRHPDVQELDAASNNGIDSIRELREAVRYRPARARFKVYILDEVHMLSTQAFNALLKTLEEPPPQVKFLFATTEIRKVPTTILSRCQTFHLRRVPQAQLRDHFARIAGKEGAEVEPEALAMIARAADGSVRDGLSLLDQAISLAGPGGGVPAEAVRDMLGLADRALVLDLAEAVLTGRLPEALALLGEAHERGADPGVVLSDLLELVHTLTRLRAVPALRDDPSLPEGERTRGAALAERLSVPSLTRAWQLLLKGLGELAEAPDRHAAADMVLIRLAYAAELPTPGELVRRLTAESDGAATRAPSRPDGAGNGAGNGTPPGPAAMLRAVAGGAGRMMEAAAPATEASATPLPEAPPPLRISNFREAVALAQQTQPLLHGNLVHAVHLVRFAQGRIELRVQERVPRDTAGQFAALLSEATGTRWTVMLSNEPGEPTLAEQGRAADLGRRDDAALHPLVQAVLAAFPGATIDTVRDSNADYYGLTAPPPEEGDPVDDGGLEFAPLDESRMEQE